MSEYSPTYNYPGFLAKENPQSGRLPRLRAKVFGIDRMVVNETMRGAVETSGLVKVTSQGMEFGKLREVKAVVDPANALGVNE
jgi:hypothetical protein